MFVFTERENEIRTIAKRKNVREEGDCFILVVVVSLKSQGQRFDDVVRHVPFRWIRSCFER